MKVHKIFEGELLFGFWLTFLLQIISKKMLLLEKCMQNRQAFFDFSERECVNWLQCRAGQGGGERETQDD